MPQLPVMRLIRAGARILPVESHGITGPRPSLQIPKSYGTAVKHYCHALHDPDGPSRRPSHSYCDRAGNGPLDISKLLRTDQLPATTCQPSCWHHLNRTNPAASPTYRRHICTRLPVG